MGNSLSLNYQFSIPGGNALLSADFQVNGWPPSAAISLPASTRCNDSGGYLLGSADTASTDPDGDIDGHLWIIDGVPYSHGHVVAVGTHVVELLAIDSRGARSYAGPQNFEVITSSSCI